MVKPSSFIKNLEPYKITSQDVWSDMAPDNLLKLDWNEATQDFGFYKDELCRIAHNRGILAWYPDYLSLKLTDALSEYVGIDSNNILTFPGSDVGLEYLCRAYLEPEDVVLTLSPTYENYFVYVLQVGASLVKIELEKPFIPDLTIIESRINSIGTVKMVYLVSPNNPCGYILPHDELKNLAKKFPETMFVIDEAYIEFTDTESFSILIKSFSNIVVFRTFSKGFGIAGVRLGYMCAPLTIINNVNKIRNGKNVSMIAQRLGICALENINKIKEWLQEVRESREEFQVWCADNNIKYYPSHGNFVLFEVSQPNEICSKLKSLGIYIRNRNKILPGSVRVTIGSKAQVAYFIDALESMTELL
jgi:histidinol-phosphate aminotransferase